MNDKMREALAEAITTMREILEDPEVLNVYKCHIDHDDVDRWQAALAQQGEQEPVGEVLDRYDWVSYGGFYTQQVKLKTLHKPLKAGTLVYTRPQPATIPEGYVLAKRDDVEASIRMMRYACHPHRSPHADDLEANMLAAAPKENNHE